MYFFEVSTMQLTEQFVASFSAIVKQNPSVHTIIVLIGFGGSTTRKQNTLQPGLPLDYEAHVIATPSFKRSTESPANAIELVCGPACKLILISSQLYIGEHGSCHKIGVVATGEIAVGECLAVIPREAILSCANSTVATLVREDKELENVSSSWIPLLIALAAESSLKVSEVVRTCIFLANTVVCSDINSLQVVVTMKCVLYEVLLMLVFTRTRATGTPI